MKKYIIPIVLNIILFGLIILDLTYSVKIDNTLYEKAKNIDIQKYTSAKNAFAFNFDVDNENSKITYTQYAKDNSVWIWKIYFKDDKYFKHEMFKYGCSKLQTLDIYVDGRIANNPNVQNLKLKYFDRCITYTNLDIERLFSNISFEQALMLVENMKYVYSKSMIEL